MKNIGVFLIGAISGVMAGLLLAPQSGKKTRAMINDEVDDRMKDFEKTISKTGKEVQKEYNKQINELTKQGKQWVDGVKESVKMN